MRLKNFFGVALALCLCICTVSNIKASEFVEHKVETSSSFSETIKYKEQEPQKATSAMVSNIEENVKW